ncbi:hypothetical protein QL285_008016 [Trifolium repens]|jgi:hypothetical protein|nr:hypothetical protein QL285_008016 [Trifolium repens]
MILNNERRERINTFEWFYITDHHFSTSYNSFGVSGSSNVWPEQSYNYELLQKLFSKSTYQIQKQPSMVDERNSHQIQNQTLISAKLLHDYKGKVVVVDNNVANAIGNNY